MELTHRVATLDDLDTIRVVVRRAIEQLQSGFLTPEQVAASHQVMGVDTQLLRDGTYILLLAGDRIAGCGGWSYRRTLFGGDASVIAREPETLNPLIDAARIRAMYTDPDFTRRGIGRRVLELCERAAWDAGFRRTEMMATMAGEPLYRSCGYERLNGPILASADNTTVPLVQMGRVLLPKPSATAMN
jgi:GNAT superfamily N-acetyltransferase